MPPQLRAYPRAIQVRVMYLKRFYNEFFSHFDLDIRKYLPVASSSLGYARGNHFSDESPRGQQTTHAYA
jgi:hypothetical protein